MLEAAQVQRLARQGRRIETAVAGDDDLGPFRLLPGTWKNEPDLAGRGWNMIALPFPAPGAAPGLPPETGTQPGFRLLLNQYNETLKFDLVDKAVPNRGVHGAAPGTVESNQFAVTLDYEQTIAQIAAEDFPNSGEAGPPGLAIHHEPGLFLHTSDPNGDGGPDVARLATIPHGTAALALGTSSTVDGVAPIPAIDALPIGFPKDLTNPYLASYQHYHQNPFQGIFDPTDPTGPLRAANEGVTITRTTVLSMDTTAATGGISNIPFIVAQANASEMRATFFIHELADRDAAGNPKLRLQYAQIVELDFIPRVDGGPGLITWPHVSVNTLEKVAENTPG